MTTFKQKILSKEIKRADAMKVRLQDLHEEPGFNLRIEDADFQASVEALADYISDGGQYPALEVRPRPEGGVWIVDGHRRKRAVVLAVKHGAPLQDKDGEVWVPIVAFEGNDADRVARVITSAEGRALSPLEVATGYARLRAFGWDNARIAQKVGKTPQHVAQLLTLADANSDVQTMVAAGGVSAAVAVEVVRKHGDDAGKVLAGAATNGKGKVTAGTMNGPKVPHKVLASLSDEVDAFIEQLPTHARARLAQIEAAVAGHQIPEGQEVSVPAAALLSLLNEHATVVEARQRQEQKARDRAAKAAQADLEDAA
jgi:5-hydroxyisourate hydrolase-like protein (transthyretin family)